MIQFPASNYVKSPWDYWWELCTLPFVLNICFVIAGHWRKLLGHWTEKARKTVGLVEFSQSKYIWEVTSLLAEWKFRTFLVCAFLEVVYMTRLAILSMQITVALSIYRSIAVSVNGFLYFMLGLTVVALGLLEIIMVSAHDLIWHCVVSTQFL